MCAGAQAEGEPYKLYFYMSPYMRSKQTTEALAGVFRGGEIAGFQEEVQLREQGASGFVFRVRAPCCAIGAQGRHGPHAGVQEEVQLREEGAPGLLGVVGLGLRPSAAPWLPRANTVHTSAAINL